MFREYTVTVFFRDGSTRTKLFNEAYKADRYHQRYYNMYPDPSNPKTQVAKVLTRRSA